MTTVTELPLNLYKTNLELQLRIAGLIQESMQKWMDLGKYIMDDGIAESTDEVEQLLKSRDLRTLSTLPGEAFLHQLLLGFGDAEAAAKTALEAQTSFVTGLQNAMRTWQKDTAQIVSQAGIDASSGIVWNDLLKAWNPAPQSISAAAAGTEAATKKDVKKEAAHG